MNIFVLIKKVPDPNLPEQFVSISPDGHSVHLHSASQLTINLYDLNAIECAVSLKEKYGGSVTVLTADDASADTYIRRAIAMGADNAVRVNINSSGNATPLTVAKAIADAIKEVGTPDLILAGRQASDTDAGLIPHAVAQYLDITSVSPIVSVGDISDDSIIIGKLSENTIDSYKITFPSVLCVSNELNSPRMPSIKGVMRSKKAEIKIVETEAPQRSDATAFFEMKSGNTKKNTITYSDCSTSEKAKALLDSLGV